LQNKQKFLRDEIVSLSKLKPHPKNPRKHSPDYIKRIERSIEAFDKTNPIICTPDYTIIAGHARLIAAQNLGLTEFPVRIFDFTPEEAEAYMIADNKLAEGSEWIDSMLVDLFSDLELKQFDVELTGYDTSEISSLRDLQGEIEEDNFDADTALSEAERSEGRAKRGDVWQLGKHRLMCGDSSTDDLNILLEGAKINLILTDPPYGIDIVGGGGSIGGGGPFGGSIGGGKVVPVNIYRRIEGDDHPFDPEYILKLNTKTLLFGANNYASKLPDNSHWLVWDKKLVSDGRPFSDAELIWTNVNSKLCLIYRHLWQGMVRAGAKAEELSHKIHPTQKPVGLLANIITDYSERGDTVADFYGGSGSTLIACEQTGRTCYMMEIDPLYCDVILKRWEDYTGNNAETILPTNSETTKNLSKT